MKLEIEKKVVISSFTAPESHKKWVEDKAKEWGCSQADVLRALIKLNVEGGA